MRYGACAAMASGRSRDAVVMWQAVMQKDQSRSGRGLADASPHQMVRTTHYCMNCARSQLHVCVSVCEVTSRDEYSFAPRSSASNAVSTTSAQTKQTTQQAASPRLRLCAW